MTTNNLIEKERSQKQHRVWVRIASACNNICIFCLDSDAHNGSLPKEESVKEEIARNFKAGHENRIIISWWEASINPKFPEYIRYAKSIGYTRVQTVTNGGMFSRPEFCKKVFDAWLDEVTFSLHWHTKELHDFLTGTPGSFDKALRGLIFIKKHYPKIIINIDVVVNKVNVDFLPKIIGFYMKLWVYEFDILQIIPLGRWFSDYRDTLFYTISEHLPSLHATWKLSHIPGMYMWTNRFPAEAFEGYEDLIQDPRKIKSETMWEGYAMFDKFIQTKGNKKPDCYWDRCSVCFLKQYCHDFIKQDEKLSNVPESSLFLHWEEFPSQVYEKYGKTDEEFRQFLRENTPVNNIPLCLWGTGKYEQYQDMSPKYTLEDYTNKYITNLYRAKSQRCKTCIHNNWCKGIHMNFIRSYGFKILQPITHSWQTSDTSK